MIRTNDFTGCTYVWKHAGEFLKRDVGPLLAVVGIDGNNGMFPITYAVVEIENKDT